MHVLQIYIDVLPGKEKELEQTFRTVFIPAISVQKGFRWVEMLHPNNSMTSYQINLSFESEDLRLQWVASSEHQHAFPKIVALCQRMSWQGFDVVSERKL
ncbi:MAG TPA: antibiotic biosynthesis monooxygenase [Spirochaetales bacterium]|nr:antibiotic biosynthesis monooxygenase [Spirochaetales bacterium]HOV37828.1 antibiotic biosynthesis monooxygenase [Spirochaetales bacterium]